MGDVIDVSWADVLRVDGVDANGYGSIPKLVMIDPDLSYKAKAIYAYLCSLAGNGVTAFPGRDTILHALSMNKDTYYIHFKALTAAGYISVAQQKEKAQGRFMHNVYTLERNPKKLQDYQPEEGEGGARLRSRGVKAAGYGDIPRTVMTDPRLSIKAKALYAYLSSFAGAGDVAFPAQKTLIYHMGISAHTYNRAMKELLACNYIEVTQRAENGRFSCCDYYIVPNPDEEKGRAEIERRAQLAADRKPPVKKAERRKPTTRIGKSSKPVAVQAVQPYGQNSDTVKPIAAEEVEPYGQKPDTGISDMEKPDTAFSDTGISDTVNPDTIINSFAINNSTINNPSILPAAELAELAIYDSLMDDDEKREYIEKELLGLPLGTHTVHLELQHCDATYSYDEKSISALVELIVECSHRTSLVIQGQTIPREKFMSRFLDLGVDEYQYVVDSVAPRIGKVKNVKGYYITALYNAKQSYELLIQAQVSQDF